MSNMEYESIIVDEIRVVAIAGGELFSCIREAIIMGCMEKRNVVLTHNDKQYRIEAFDLMDCVVTSE